MPGNWFLTPSAQIRRHPSVISMHIRTFSSGLSRPKRSQSLSMNPSRVGLLQIVLKYPYTLSCQLFKVALAKVYPLSDAGIKAQNIEVIGSNWLFFLAFPVLLRRPMSGPAFLAVYGSVRMGLKRHFTFAAAVVANGCMNRFCMELLEKMVILEARPPCLSVTQHFGVFPQPAHHVEEAFAPFFFTFSQRLVT